MFRIRRSDRHEKPRWERTSRPTIQTSDHGCQQEQRVVVLATWAGGGITRVLLRYRGVQVCSDSIAHRGLIGSFVVRILFFPGSFIPVNQWATAGKPWRTTSKPPSSPSRVFDPTQSIFSWSGPSTARVWVIRAPCLNLSGHKVIYSTLTLKEFIMFVMLLRERLLMSICFYEFFFFFFPTQWE